MSEPIRNGDYLWDGNKWILSPREKLTPPLVTPKKAMSSIQKAKENEKEIIREINRIKSHSRQLTIEKREESWLEEINPELRNKRIKQEQHELQRSKRVKIESIMIPPSHIEYENYTIMLQIFEEEHDLYEEITISDKEIYSFFNGLNQRCNRIKIPFIINWIKNHVEKTSSRVIVVSPEIFLEELNHSLEHISDDVFLYESLDWFSAHDIDNQTDTIIVIRTDMAEIQSCAADIMNALDRKHCENTIKNLKLVDFIISDTIEEYTYETIVELGPSEEWIYDTRKQYWDLNHLIANIWIKMKHDKGWKCYARSFDWLAKLEYWN